MARDNVTPVALVTNVATAQGAATTIVPANGIRVALNPAGNTRRAVIDLDITTTGGTVTVKAGVYPPAWRQGLGDYVLGTAAPSTRYFLEVESARFIQADGSIWIDFQTGLTGNARAYTLPLDV